MLAVTVTMYIDTVQCLTSWQDDASAWRSHPKIIHKGVDIDLCKAIGKSPVTPPNAPDQPTYHPDFSEYQFDPHKYNGVKGYKLLANDLKNSCDGCTLYRHKTDVESNFYQLRCSCYRTRNNSSENFSDGKLTKDGVKAETIKQTNSQMKSAWDRMSNPKMKYIPKIKQSVDRRGKKKTKQAEKRRTLSICSSESNEKCPMNLRLFMNSRDGTWHLHQESVLQHSFHPQIKPDATKFDKSDLNKHQLETLNLLFDSGISPTIIARIMTEAVKSSTNKKGEFLAQTIRNIGNQEKLAMEKFSGMNPDWSMAERLIETIKE